jgi:signal transduction histidine kinase
VAVQQNYAKASGLSETVLLPDIIEDALKMCSEAFLRHEIKVVRDYEKTPPATLDRHKVLQILFNLLDNAIYACEAAKTPEKEITIRIRKHSAGNHFQIQVADNGVGIPAGNLPGIFTQGFSTRSGGHGFGLHSSLLAAQEMGGSLNVQTGGPDCGATFTLELPLEDSEQNSEEPSGVETVAA